MGLDGLEALRDLLRRQPLLNSERVSRWSARKMLGTTTRPHLLLEEVDSLRQRQCAHRRVQQELLDLFQERAIVRRHGPRRGGESGLLPSCPGPSASGSTLGVCVDNHTC